jgi:hypothetical protein
MKSIVIYQKENKFRKLLFMFWPIKDALFNNFKHTPDSVIKKMSTQYNKPITKIVFSPLKKIILSLFVPQYTESTKAALMEL